MHIYDTETYPNIFTLAIKPRGVNKLGYIFEISDRRNDWLHACNYVRACKRMVGFNNLYFDWPIVNLMLEGANTAQALYTKAMQIIQSDNPFDHVIWKPAIEQIDLYKIHHFDNQARRTSLKMLEFNMRADTIQDLPFEPGRTLTHDEMDVLRHYNYFGDVQNTEKFLEHTIEMIDFRDEMGPETINYNDTKIGKQYFIKQLEERLPGRCYAPGSGKQPNQTHRPNGVNLGDIILPHVSFTHPILIQNLDWLKRQTVIKTKGDLNTVLNVNGFHVYMGLGGIHGSVDREIVTATDTHAVLDLDVTSYYPSLAIVNGFYPEHLGPEFCEIYRDLKNERLQHAKGTTKNAAIKLALNGVYGDSNNVYSPFYDPKYMLSVTINGQLLLMMLMEALQRCPDLKMIQINTDGLTIKYPREHTEYITAVCDWWQNLTGLELEDVEYNRMFIRDVNNYIAESVDGKLKRKGCYEYDLQWHQNHSALIVPKAAEAVMVHGKDLRTFIREHKDTWDFLLRTKVPRSSHLELDDGTRLQNITRYYITLAGNELIKVMPPLNKPDKTVFDTDENGNVITRVIKHDKPRRISINKGWQVTECNTFDGNVVNLNEDFYINEVEKILL